VVRNILELFGLTLGLHTNFAKCSVSPIACSEETATAASAVMECQLAPYPIKYLGIHLGIRRLPSEAHQPLVDRITDRLPTWKAAMMPKAGRLALIKSVLAAIPLHQLMVLSMDKKTLRLRGFLGASFGWLGRQPMAATAMSTGPGFVAHCALEVWVFLTWVAR
jgi:hypothetical protein